ncbi:MAG: hypothetical protein RI945_231 [Candidatus Parcubacteria bacterium]
MIKYFYYKFVFSFFNFMKYLFRSFYLFFFITIFSFIGVFALQIKNVNYGASNNNDRWIEVFNDGADISDFTSNDYKVLDSKDTTKHSINILQGDTLFRSSSTVYISPSTNIPAAAEKAFKSTYSLDKTSGYISIINSDNSQTYFCFSYGGVSCPNGQGGGDTTSTTSTTTIVNPTSTTIINTVYVYVPVNNQNKYGDINVLLPGDRVVPAGAEADYTVKVTDSHGSLLSGLDFNWSFGDGGEKFGKDVKHHYIYPGEYILIATADGYTSGGQARMNVKVINPDLKILKVGAGGKENFIDLFNDTDYDLFLSNFYLNLDNTFYKIPKNFMIGKKSVVHLSGESMGFKLPAYNVSLHFPNKNPLISFFNNLNINSTTSTSTSWSTAPLKSISETISTEIKREIKTEVSNKQTPARNFIESTDTKVIKKLILGKQDIKKDPEIQEKKEVKDVDIGIVKWFKSLIY